MRHKIIKADTLGCMVKFDGDPDVYYIGEKVGSGYYSYQDKAAFRDRIGICYIPYNSFMDEVEMDENVPDELFDLIARNKVPSGAVAMDNGYTYDDLYDVVWQWIGDALDDVDGDVQDEFCEYFTAVLFANLVTSDPEDYIYTFDPVGEYSDWLDTTSDPRLTKQQAKELGYE